ncbi:MAG TPA: M56 family metallopeptidase [Thermoanaerobaculia bacterium]|jgi:TonB family protein|nr:M56 family metallopeptidase [Thermoanaerobaculia bacterium]
MSELIAWVLQSTLLLAAGLALPAVFRLRDARVRLAWFHGLLLAILLLPLVQPESSMPVFSQEIQVAARLLPDAAGPALESLALDTAARLLIPVLALGTLGRLAWLGVGLVALRRWSREARPAALGPDVERIVEQIGVEARLLESDRVESPVTFGWRHPVVLLPPDLPEEARPGVVCHELVHVRRRDWLAALFEEGVRALLWFHPGVWLLLSRIALSREQVVDREAARLTGSRRAYLEALRTVACRSWQPIAIGLPFFHRGHLRERVAHLCKEVSMSRSRTAALLTASAGLLALTAVLAILAFPMSGTALAASQPMKIEGEVQRPEALNIVEPEYPESLMAKKIESIATLETVIDETGHVTQVEVKGSTGYPEMDQSAIDAVQRWTFKPATLHGKPVAVYYWLKIRFALD